MQEQKRTGKGATEKRHGPLSQQRLKHLERRLLEERKRALREFQRNFQGAAEGNDDGGLRGLSTHPADQGTDAMQRETDFLLASREGRFLVLLDEALRRLYTSPATFGSCLQCETPIAFERLDVMPHARHCVDCVQRENSGLAA